MKLLCGALMWNLITFCVHRDTRLLQALVLLRWRLVYMPGTGELKTDQFQLRSVKGGKKKKERKKKKKHQDAVWCATFYFNEHKRNMRNSTLRQWCAWILVYSWVTRIFYFGKETDISEETDSTPFRDVGNFFFRSTRLEVLDLRHWQFWLQQNTFSFSVFRNLVRWNKVTFVFPFPWIYYPPCIFPFSGKRPANSVA